jgi:hypothetical protein
MTSSPTGARCGQHPDVAAVALCARCGGYLCGACTEVLEATAYCAPCAERHRRALRPSQTVRLALGANVLGLLFLVAPLMRLSWPAHERWARAGGRVLELAGTLAVAMVSTFIATRELRRRATVGNRGGALLLRVLSALNLLGVLLWGALFAAFVLSQKR